MMKTFQIVKRYEVQAEDQQEAVDRLTDLEILGNQFLVETGMHVREASFPNVWKSATPSGFEKVFSA